jgi:hypothetical protein
VPALAVAVLGLLALWLGLARRGRGWVVAACIGLAVSGAALVAARSPFQPVARATSGAHRYQLAIDRASSPELYLLFACDTTGLICQQVAAYAPFDVASGRHAAGTPALTSDTAGHDLTLRLGTSVIGVYRVTAA